MKEGKVKKQNALAYNFLSLWRTKVIPRIVRQWQRKLCLHGWESRHDADYIRERVNYYNKITTPKCADVGATAAEDIRLKDSHSCYWFDIMRYVRGFDMTRKLSFIDGDTWQNPDFYCIGKARRLDTKDVYVALMKLDRRRHFAKVSDFIPFNKKEERLIFRGYVGDKESRIRFFEKWGHEEIFDLGDTDRNGPEKWKKPWMPIEKHFRYKYVLALEGNDVATAVQWICASNCIPVMPRPTVESWLMHGRMVAGEHYIEIKSDFSDVKEKIEYYNAHPQEAERISEASKDWIRQFDDTRRENIISYLVAQRYLENVF